MALLYFTGGERAPKQEFYTLLGAEFTRVGALAIPYLGAGGATRGSGSWQMAMTNTNGFDARARRAFPVASQGNDWFVKGAFTFSAEPQDDHGYLFWIRNVGFGTGLRRMYIDFETGHERKLTIVQTVSSEYARTTTQLTANTVYLFTWAIHNEDGDTYDVLKVYAADGTLLETLSPGAWTYTANQMGGIDFGANMAKGGNNPNTTIKIDHFVVNDGSGTEFNVVPPLDTIEVAPLLNGDVGTPDWKKADGTTTGSYTEMDEQAANDDTDYNRSMTTDAELDILCELQGQSIQWDSDSNPLDPDDYTLMADDRIDGLQVTCRYRQGTASTASVMKWLWEDNGVEGSEAFIYQAQTGWGSSSTAGTGNILAKFMPVTPTGGYAWPQSILDTFRFGLRKVSGATDFWCTALTPTALISLGAGDHSVPGAAAVRRRGVRVI
jgi:hypothetical protein